MTQEALIEVLRNQHQNIVQQQNLIAGQGAQISELTKLVSGLVQMQTDVLKDQAQREADERERKAEEERKAAALDKVDFPDTGNYTKRLARGIVDAVRIGRKDP